MRPYGPVPALASLSARQAKEAGLLTSGTCGPRFTSLSNSAVLQSSLASKLQAATATLGSTLFNLTWKQRALPSGRLKPSLAASARRTSDPAIIGWPTPRLSGQGETLENWERRKATEYEKYPGKGLGSMSLTQAVSLAAHPDQSAAPLSGWPTASARNWKDSPGMATTGTNPDGSTRTRLDQLPRVATLASWPCTPMAGSSATATYNQAGNSDYLRKTEALMGKPVAGSGITLPEVWSGPARLTDCGALLIGSDAATKSGGQLSPAHSLWLMLGPFATAWASCGERVTRSRSGKPRGSSSPSDKA